MKMRGDEASLYRGWKNLSNTWIQLRAGAGSGCGAVLSVEGAAHDATEFRE
jgi:hypothetical protein